MSLSVKTLPLKAAYLSMVFGVCALSTALTSNVSFAQNTTSLEQQQDGVKVGKRSFFRKLVPTSSIENSAALQYGQTMSKAKQENTLVSDQHPQVQRLRAIAHKLIPFALRWNERAPQWQWEINLLASKEINAYCAPGGKIAFYTGILDTLQLTDDEIAIVMGHEMSHALREHGAERAGKTLAANLAVKGLEIFAEHKGYNPNVAGTVGSGAAQVALLSFSRADETEADVVGLDIAARAGYDPRAGIVVWQKMALVNKSAPPKWLSTHPPGKDRINEIQRHLPEVMPLYLQAKGLSSNQLAPYVSNSPQIQPIPYP